MLLCGALAGCGATGALPRLDSPRERLAGYAVADEPNAARIARDILAEGGSAADAGVALALALTVTLPSRASLGGGGACLVRSGRELTENQLIGRPPPQKPPATESFAFLPAAGKPGGKIGLPMLARGLAAVQAKYGRLRWAQLVAPAEKTALLGFPVSRAFAADIAAAHADISGPSGKPIAEGDWLPEAELGETLARLRSRGPGDLYSGALAADYVAGTAGEIDAAALRTAMPVATMPEGVAFGPHRVYFSATPGGAHAASLWQAAKAEPAGSMRLLSALFGGAETKPAQALGVAEAAPVAGTSDAATSFVVVDWQGAAMACSLTMGRPFGAGKIVGETGILASQPVPGPLADGMSGAALLVANDNVGKLLAAFAGGGEASGAAAMVETALAALVRPLPVERALSLPRADGGEGGQVNGVACPSGLPAETPDCTAHADPRGAGVTETAERVR